ncbi:50S ribosomal protein L29 [Candidatus Woesearchaeota archaeon]|nr:50S ribosomal protein L29 [Candidatus Woesearchaeota archaeon]
MTFKELVQLSAEEQEIKLKELELELIKLNAQVATGTPPKNAGQIRKIRKEIARIMFIKGNKNKTKPSVNAAQAKKASAQPNKKTATKQKQKQNKNE